MSETSDIDILITELHDKLTLVHHDAAVIPKSDLINLFLEVVSLIKVDYATYRKYIPKVLGLLEKNHLQMRIKIYSFMNKDTLI